MIRRLSSPCIYRAWFLRLLAIPFDSNFFSLSSYFMNISIIKLKQPDSLFVLELYNCPSWSKQFQWPILLSIFVQFKVKSSFAFVMRFHNKFNQTYWHVRSYVLCTMYFLPLLVWIVVIYVFYLHVNIHRILRQILMEELRTEAVNKVRLVKEKSIEFVSGIKKKHISDNLPEEEITRIWGGDRRLSLFSYTIETINLLILPMIHNR